MNANTSTGAATTTATATEGEMTALSAVLLQVSETMNRMTARLDNLEMAVATTMSQATPAGSAGTTTGTTNAVTAPTVDTRHVTYRRSTDGEKEVTAAPARIRTAATMTTMEIRPATLTVLAQDEFHANEAWCRPLDADAGITLETWNSRRSSRH
ncbi:hypothetical protein L917_03192, partial [Phytophthora nicotianae]